MNVRHLMSLVGAPPVRAEVYRRANGELTEWGWRDTLAGELGWWFAVTSGERVLALGWTLGGAKERDDEIRRAINKHMRPAVPEAVSA